jgi:hypothetical protein
MDLPGRPVEGEPREANLTAADAIHWAKTRACKGCRHSDNPDHDACGKALETAELIQLLVDRVEP